MNKTKLIVITSLFVVLLLNNGFSYRTCANEQEFVLNEIGHIPAEGRTDDVQAVGDIVYILDFEEGFLTYNISDPANPTLLGSYKCLNSINPAVMGGHSFFIRGNYAIVGFQHGGLKIINITNPTDLRVVGAYYGGTDTYHIAVVEDLVYLAMEYHGLQIIDISDITLPTKVGEFNNGNPLYYVEVIENFVYTKDDEQDKLLCLNVTDPSNITEIGQFDWVAIDIKMVGDIGFVGAFSDGVLIYDFSDPTAPILIGQHYDGGATCDIDIIGNLAYITDWEDGLEVLNITNPENPVEIAQFNDGGESVSSFIQNDFIFIAERDNGLEILRIEWFSENTSGSTSLTSSWTTTSFSTITSETSETPSFELIHIPILLFIFLVVRMKKRRLI